MNWQEAQHAEHRGADDDAVGSAAARLMEAAVLPDGAGAPSGEWQPPEPTELEGVVPGYHFIRLLGRGGMGAVYEAVQVSLDRSVAIKLLPPALEGDPEFAVRFRREAKAMARLNHPNIVQIHDYGQATNGQHYFVMELVDGCDLHQLVKSGQLDAEGALNAVSQVCDALQYAHEQGFVHRDIKPANVLMNRQGILKVGDFGLAKLLEDGDSALRRTENMSLTLSGYALGTPNYAAPEQMDGSGQIDHRADLYSLGVMFYEMLTREIPRGAPTPPSRSVANLDVRIDGVVFKAMSAEPDERYQTAVELRQDVDVIRTTPLPAPAEVAAAEAAAAKAARAVVPAPGRSARRRTPAEDELLRSTRSMNNTLLVLGLVALGTLGTVAFYLADRKAGDVISTETTVTQTEVNNSYFTQLVAFGVTTPQDLAEIVDFRPWGSGFVGVSKNALAWEAAVDLAKRTGAEILGLPGAPGEEVSVRSWLEASYSAHLTEGAWVRRGAKAAVVRGEPGGDELAAEGSVHRAIFSWGAPVSVAPPAPAVAQPKASANASPPRLERPADATAPPAQEEWTNRQGVTIRAEFVALKGAAVVLRKEGREYAIPLERLTPESAARAQSLGGPAK